jgi:hypothetical protein
MNGPTKKTTLNAIATLLGVEMHVIYSEYGWDKLTNRELGNTYHLLAELSANKSARKK